MSAGRVPNFSIRMLADYFEIAEFSDSAFAFHTKTVFPGGTREKFSSRETQGTPTGRAPAEGLNRTFANFGIFLAYPFSLSGYRYQAGSLPIA